MAALVTTSTTRQFAGSRSLRLCGRLQLYGKPLLRSISSDNNKREKLSNDIALGSENAIRKKTTREVFRGWFVFKILSYDAIVDNSVKLYEVSLRLLGARLTEKLLRLTVFGQFVGGLDEKEGQETALNWKEQGVASIWYKSVERDMDTIQSPHSSEEMGEQEKYHDSVNTTYLKSIELAAQYNTARHPKFMSFKVTSIVNPKLLHKLNTAIYAAEEEFLSLAGPGKHKTDRYIPLDIMQEKFPSFQLQGHHEHRGVSIVEWNKHFCYLKNLSNFSQLKVSGDVCLTFSDMEKEQLRHWIQRLRQLGEAAESHNVSILVDAEHRYFQRAIEHFTLHLFFKHYNNTSSCPRFFNTIQTYLKDSFDTLLINEATALSYGVKMAVKLVRGCYLEHERLHAATLGLESPIHPSKADTDNSYHHCLERAMESLRDHNTSVFVATHNKETVQRALDLMEKYSVLPSDDRVSFGQQMGMADHLTLPLANAGYHVCKLVPYGSLDDMVPFLSRRANENRGIMKNAQDERMLYFRELKRKLFTIRK